jgi:hypothetical protein
MASRFDAHVTEGSVLPGAVNLEFPVDGHFRPLGHARCIAMIVREVESGAGSRLGDADGSERPQVPRA